MEAFINNDIDRIINYLETLEYDVRSKCIGKFFQKWKVIKIFFTGQIENWN